MNLSMTGGAVSVTGTARVMKRGWLSARLWTGTMAFQTQLMHRRSPQHARVNGAVRLVAGLASLDLTRRMFKHKRALLVAMAADTALLRCDCGPLQAFEIGQVRIVAIAAIHPSLENEMPIRFSKASLDRGMALSTELGDWGFDQSIRRRFRVQFVTVRAGHVVSTVSGAVKGCHAQVLGVAGQAAADSPLGRLRGEAQARLVSTGFDVAIASAVTVLALDVVVSASEDTWL